MAKTSKGLKMVRKNASAISRALQSFSKSSAIFSSDRPRLIDKYENKWVGIHEGKVVAVADTLDEATRAISRRGIPLNETMIRRIERKEKTLIL